MKSLLPLAGIDIKSCRTNDCRVSELEQFLKKNSKNILLQVGKSPDLTYCIYVKKCEYFEKINDFKAIIFGGDTKRVAHFSYDTGAVLWFSMVKAYFS